MSSPNDEVLEGEVVSESVEFSAPLPLGKSKSGWCTGPEGAIPQHDKCPAIFPDQQYPDPARTARKGQPQPTYTRPGHRCPCPCHARDLD